MLTRRSLLGATGSGLVLLMVPEEVAAALSFGALAERLRGRWDALRDLALGSLESGSGTPDPAARAAQETLATGMGAAQLRVELSELTREELRQPELQALLEDMAYAAGSTALLTRRLLGELLDRTLETQGKEILELARRVSAAMAEARPGRRPAASVARATLDQGRLDDPEALRRDARRLQRRLDLRIRAVEREVGQEVEQEVEQEGAEADRHHLTGRSVLSTLLLGIGLSVMCIFGLAGAYFLAMTLGACLLFMCDVFVVPLLVSAGIALAGGLLAMAGKALAREPAVDEEEPEL